MKTLITPSIRISRAKAHQSRQSYKSILSISAIFMGSLLLSACQSTALSQNTTAANSTPIAAKTALANALKKQRHQSFSYHSNLEMNNDQAFIDLNTEPLVASEYADSHCADSHDEAYIALAAQADSQGSAAALDDSAQREALKSDYMTCIQAYEIWERSQYDSDPNADADISTHVSTDFTTEALSPYYQQLFDDYDNKDTAQDVKKAQQLDAYVFKPLSLNAQGIYQPLAGRFTILASAQYQARNLTASVNQPIYVDFKTGNIYLWADNVAFATSELLDDKLGTQWQNKWLKIAIDDGTLPKGFGRAVIKSHFEALDRVYKAAPIAEFDFITPSTLATASPNLPVQQLTPMLNTAQIIRRTQSAQSYQDAYSDYLQFFYTQISEQYPELVADTISTESTHIGSHQEQFTSKAVVQQVLKMMTTAIDNRAIDTDMPDSSAANTDSPAPVQALYGFDSKGDIQWQHIRREIPRASRSHQRGLMMDMLQQYTPISAQAIAYPNLPLNTQTPNASNSIDVREYSQELLAAYRSGNGATIGKILFGMMPILKNKVGGSAD